MDLSCHCTPPLTPPFSDTASRLSHGRHGLSPPGLRGLPCKYIPHSVISQQRPPCPCSQSCKQCLLGNQTFPTSDVDLCPHCINKSSPVCCQESQNSACLERCIHSHPLWLSAQIEGSRMQPVLGSWAVLSKDPVQEAIDRSEHQLMPENCIVYFLNTKDTDFTGQCGHCVPSGPKHYAIYSSPISSSYLRNESGHRFSNNIPPVLVALYPRERGLPPHVEQVSQIDRTPTPPLAESYLAFSG
ncbi:uncharacterized protein LOC134494923 [Candoia aspera]|uniref:uncharacterized protein LOC134494923 n=1 Tax=Candoia aspera TaxID=51853 RepID=UPI002FD7BBD4